ncbi:prolyl oligopeptidase family serine peptidase [Bacillus sp. ISL-51]|uniref:prolyl oligopeptidase family serine peptidase n=1 Tax=Bacteria TaxID=2 RepID=UPI001BE644B8|nr:MULTISPECIES: prolyl oligopeptidase family serine peptidase [unclassified Bacillus (in: firmicutes)]MBT2573852.1 prolyl oligopeptidase family serine peptidase [Bacillus sp. ISL-51]MBT2634816.1 prolyl oligopeptidase family serine peptidase [Bacillus sp. ISL-26]MBT2712291.1 prolyl oligopeptidase family serine peptidase [Pseudomonas sp. ISL-88]
MIQIDHQNVSDIPFLHIVKEEYRDRAVPLVFFIHGFTSAKEHNLHFAYLLAEKGFRAVLPEALYHGERAEQLSAEELSVHFWDIVLNEISELRVLKEDFEARGLIEEGRIGLAGTSMGGITTLGAMAAYDWVKVGVSLMGSPNYTAFFQQQIDYVQQQGMDINVSQEKVDELFERLKMFDLSLQPEKLRNRPLLFWHGVKDKVVPYAPTRCFYETIKPHYSERPELLQFIKDERADHKVPRHAVLETVAWFHKHL